jgi:hypothetical protein
MNSKFINKKISTFGLALSFSVLTACGGGGGSSNSSASTAGTTPVSAATIAAAQAALDASGSVSPLDYSAIDAGRTACLDGGTGVIDTETEIGCYQTFLETISPVEAPVV